MPTQPSQKKLRASGSDSTDGLSAGSGLLSQSSLLGDLNAIRSQVKRLVGRVSGGAHWYDDPGSVQLSVFGRTGAVVAALHDYAASLIDNDSSVSGSTVKDALNTLLAAVASVGSTSALASRLINSGNGLAGGGDLTADRTLTVVADADGSIAVGSGGVKVGALASDAQHGDRGGGALHAQATDSVDGFMSAADKTKLDGVATGAQVNTVASVFSRTGAVAAALHDYAASLIDNDSSASGATVKDALNALLTSVGLAALASRLINSGNGLSGGGDLTADRTLTVVADADASIAVGSGGVKVGVLATDAQHGLRGGDTLHALATSSLAGFLSAAGYTKISQLLAPLLVDRTVHVDSSSGNDTTGNGTSGLPWQTLSRAWTERLTYGELRAKYIVQLHGVGPYTMPVMGASVCGVGGYFIVQGDPTVDVAIATGTFTGDLNTTTYVLPTSSGLGSDTLKTYFLEITSGACAGVRTNIVTNTDTSITIPDRQWRTALGAVANGNTFRVFAPGTVINVPAAAVGSVTPGAYDWAGGVLLAIGAVKVVRHVFYNVALTLAGQATLSGSDVALVGVRTTGNASFVFMMFSRSRVAFGTGPDASVFLGGSPTNNFKLFSYGLSLSDTTVLEVGGGSTVMGSYYLGGGGLGLGYVSIGDEWISCGGRHDQGVTINGGRFEMYSATSEYVLASWGFLLTQRAQLLIGVASGSQFVFALTSGSCVLMQRGSFFGYGSSNTTGISGGTTDAAGYAVSLGLGGGAVVIKGAPTLTGGNGNGNDIKTTNFVKANAYFAAAGDFIGDMGGAEVVLRA